MIRNFILTKKYRDIYVREMIRILVDKYHISRPAMARAIGVSATYMRDFYSGHINLGDKSLDKFESFIDDLYEPLIRDEIEMNQKLIEEVSEASRLEIEYEKKKTKK